MFLILSRIIKRVFYIGTLSCAPLLIANLSFYSSSILSTNPSLRSETRPHAVSVCVGVPDSTVPRLSTPERVGPHRAPSLSARRRQQAPIRSALPPPCPSHPAAHYSSACCPVSSPSQHHLLGTMKPRLRYQFLTGTGRPLHRAASPPGHALSRQLLLTVSMRPRRSRSESSLHISSPCPIHRHQIDNIQLAPSWSKYLHYSTIVSSTELEATSLALCSAGRRQT